MFLVCIYVNVLLLLLTEGILDFAGQLSKNIIIGRGIIMRTLLLIHQRNINQSHQRHCMITLAPFICLCIGIVALSDELGCSTIEFFVVTIDDNFYFFIVNMLLDM